MNDEKAAQALDEMNKNLDALKADNQQRNTRFITHIDFHNSVIVMNVTCGYCKFIFYVMSRGVINYDPVSLAIMCPQCDRRYFYDKNTQQWISDYPIIINENRSTIRILKEK